MSDCIEKINMKYGESLERNRIVKLIEKERKEYDESCCDDVVKMLDEIITKIGE